jgi:hypothetical protein
MRPLLLILALTLTTCGTREAPTVSTSASVDRDLEVALFPLSDQALFARGITSVDQPGGKQWAVAWTEDRGAKFDAVDRVLRDSGTLAGGSCGLGRCGWYVNREDFFRARRALLADVDVARLGVQVVTPHPESTK